MIYIVVATAANKKRNNVYVQDSVKFDECELKQGFDSTVIVA